METYIRRDVEPGKSQKAKSSRRNKKGWGFFFFISPPRPFGPWSSCCSRKAKVQKRLGSLGMMRFKFLEFLNFVEQNLVRFIFLRFPWVWSQDASLESVRYVFGIDLSCPVLDLMFKLRAGGGRLFRWLRAGPLMV